MTTEAATKRLKALDEKIAKIEQWQQFVLERVRLERASIKWAKAQMTDYVK
jgi:hypothetical protein